MRKRIFMGVAVFVIVFGALASLLTAGIVRAVSLDQLSSRLTEEAQLVRSRMKTLGTTQALSSLVSLSRVTLIRPDGTVLFDNWVSDRMENHLDRPEVRQALETGTGKSVRYSDTLRAQTVYVAQRLEDGSILRLAAPEQLARRIYSGIAPFVILGIIGLVLLSLPAINCYSVRLLKPLLSIDLDHPEDARVSEELLPLVRRIDAQNRLNRAQMEAMEARQQELDALLGGMHEGFIALGPKDEVILINPSACSMLGVESGNTLGRNLREIDRSTEVLDLLDRMRSSGSAEGRLEKNGRSYALSASRLENRRGAVLLFSDQTEKMQGEAMRKQFTANVSHELRTPLTTILGYAEMLENGMVKQEDLQQFYHLIHRESSRMINLMEDILRLSRLDEGYVNGKREKVSLRDVAKEACESLELSAEEKKVRLSFSGEEAFIPGDRTLLDELCYNLVDNAIKYNNESGSVEVGVKGGAQAVLTVTDTGIGIAPEHHARVFERFYRTDASRSKATGGTGLGLSIVKHAAEYHHGKITLRSRPGEGTTVTVAFPAWQEQNG